MENIEILSGAVITMIVLSVSLISMRAGKKAKTLSFWKKVLLDAVRSYMVLPILIFGITICIKLSDRYTIPFLAIFTLWMVLNNANIDRFIFYISGIITIIYFWILIFAVVLNSRFNGIPGIVATFLLCLADCVFSSFFVSEASKDFKVYINSKEQFSFKNITASTIFKALTAALPAITGIIDLLKALKIIK